MTLVVVPACTRDTVSTAGSKTGMRRVIIACRAVTISHATGTGSTASWGMEAWPPSPVTVICSSSADAMSVPPRVATQPAGSMGVMCTAKARSMGPWRSSRPSSNITLAPP